MSITKWVQPLWLRESMLNSAQSSNEKEIGPAGDTLKIKSGEEFHSNFLWIAFLMSTPKMRLVAGDIKSFAI